MSKLTDRAQYIRGVANGMDLKPEKPTHRLILEMVSLMADMSDELERLSAAQADLTEAVEDIDEDVCDLMDVVYEIDDDAIADDDDDDYEDEEEDADGEGFCEVSYECPHCGIQLTISGNDADLDEDSACPVCGGHLFPDAAADAEPTDVDELRALDGDIDEDDNE